MSELSNDVSKVEATVASDVKVVSADVSVAEADVSKVVKGTYTFKNLAESFGAGVVVGVAVTLLAHLVK